MITLSRKRAAKPRAATGSWVADRYRALVHQTEQDDRLGATEAKLIGVTSCASGAGVSTVATDLAIVAAETCQRPVLLLDLSGARPFLAARLGLSEDLGLARALEAESIPSDCAVASSIPNLSLLAMNDVVPAQGFKLDIHSVATLLRKLKREGDFVIVDLPVAESALCLSVGSLLDGILLVIEAERTDSRLAVRAKQCLTQANADVLGVILNKYCRDLPNWLDGKV